MERQVLDKLKLWKDRTDRKPLIMRGARQVGKTWLLKEFGRQCFKDVCYANFEETRSLGYIFQGDNLSPMYITDQLSIFHGTRIQPISSGNRGLDAFIGKLNDYLKTYFVVGGMPAAVSKWLETRDFNEVEKIQRNLIWAYESDFSKHAPKEDIEKIRLEVKSGKVVNAKSLKIYSERYSPRKAFRTKLASIRAKRDSNKHPPLPLVCIRQGNTTTINRYALCTHHHSPSLRAS